MSFTYSGGVITQANEAGKSITSVASITDGIRVTVSAHGYSVGDLIQITGTTDYNGAFFISAVATNTFDLTNQYFWDDTSLVYTSSQTGTAARGDKNFSGVSGLTGVTTSTEADITIYDLGNNRLQINGALALANTGTLERLKITTDTTNDLVKITNSGIWYIGDVMLDADTEFPDENYGYTAIETDGSIADNPTPFSNDGTSSGYVAGRLPSVSLQDSSITIARYVSIYAYTGFGQVDSAKFRADNCMLYSARDYRFYPATARISDCTIRSSGGFFVNYEQWSNNILVPGPSDVFKTYLNISSSTGAITADVFNIPDKPYEYIALWGSANMPRYNCYNAFRGSDYDATNRNSSDTSDAPLERGWEINIYKQVNTTLSFGGSGSTGTKVAVLGKTGQSYLFTTSAGAVGTQDIQLAYFINPADSQTITKTYYSKNNNETDLFDFLVFDYRYEPIESEEELKGNNVLTFIRVLTADPLITVSKATADAYTAYETAQKAYDGAKAYREDNFSDNATKLILRSGNQLYFDGAAADAIVIDATAGTKMSYAGTTLTFKAATFTGGCTGTGTLTLQNGAVADQGVYDCTSVSADSSIFGSTLTDFTCTKLIITGTGTGTITLDGGTLTEIEVTGGANVTINQAGGNVLTNTTETSGTITVNPEVATLNFSNLTDATVEIFDDSGVSQQRYSAQTGSLQYVTPYGSTGTWRYVVDRIGYIPLRGSYAVTGGDVAINGSLTQLTTVTGEVMYTGTTSALVNVTFDFITPCMCIEIGDGAVSPQTVFDECEQALVTVDGMKWQNTYGTLVRFAELPNLGDSLFMEGNIRIKRALAGDVNAQVAGYVSSTDGIVLDGSNGEVLYALGLSVADFWAYATRTLTAGTKDTEIDTILTNTNRVDGLIEDVGGDRFTTKALEQAPSGGGGGGDVNVTQVGGVAVTGPDDLKADVSGLSTFDNSVDTVITDTASREASKADISALETKAQADTRQTALIAEHDATQASIAALNDFDPTTQEVTTDAASRTASKADISSLETKAQADARQAALIAEHDATQTQISGLNDFDPSTQTVTTDTASRDASKADTSSLATKSDVINASQL